ncbi:MAG: ADP-ribosylglycohydrolase family protein [Armatimonadetes bacterium]|nr:ADP-ribosylglycohydrolase family protein [Armatimonadota bacterium]
MLRPDGPRSLPAGLPPDVLFDRVYGAWLGRAAGCLLGKPVEGWTKERIEETLRFCNAWPLDDYFPPVPPNQRGLGYDPWAASWLRGNIAQMPRDDDMDYPILGLHLLEEHGPLVTSEAVAQQWLTHLPYEMVYTAERVAYRNLVNGIRPPLSGCYHNPYREWIGAQIRADIWGWTNPGEPENAAAMAYADAEVSHVKNGAYGEMFFAALLAAAFVLDDIDELIGIGLSEIPAECRLAEAIQDVVLWSKESSDWEQTFARIKEKYGHYHPVHTINNAAVVVMALMHGEKDFGKTISIAVMGGWDTDCNGATAGSVIGTLLGARALPPSWIAPLNDRISSVVVGFSDVRLSELAQRTCAQIERIATTF